LHLCDVFDKMFNVEECGQLWIAFLHGEELLSFNQHYLELGNQVQKIGNLA